MKYWTESLNDYIAFNYSFSFGINNENYIERIIFLETEILKSGYELNIFMPIYKFGKHGEFNKLLSSFKNKRTQELLKKDYGYINVCDFQNMKYFNKDVLTIGISIDNIEIKYTDRSTELSIEEYTNKDKSKEIIEFQSYPNLLNDFNDEYYMEKKAGFTLTSYSNIWFDKIRVTKLLTNYIIYPDLPFDNSKTSKIITPKFNSFLAKIKEVITKLSGSVNFNESSYKQVSLNGVELDGKLVYE